MTALEARGKIVQAGPVSNEKLALRKYFWQFRGQEVQVAVEACGFWPAFREVVEPEVRRLVLVHPQRVNDGAGRDRRDRTLSRQRSVVQLRGSGAAGAGIGGESSAGRDHAARFTVAALDEIFSAISASRR